MSDIAWNTVRDEPGITVRHQWNAQKVSKPLVIVLDNASIHGAAAIRPALALLEKEGVKFQFLSP